MKLRNLMEFLFYIAKNPENYAIKNESDIINGKNNLIFASDQMGNIVAIGNSSELSSLGVTLIPNLNFTIIITLSKDNATISQKMSKLVEEFDINLNTLIDMSMASKYILIALVNSLNLPHQRDIGFSNTFAHKLIEAKDTELTLEQIIKI